MNTKFSFECPKGFTKECVTSQLYLDDLDEDSELWFVRMPSDVDPSAVENQEILLNGESNILTNGEQKYYDCGSERCDMRNLCLVLPRKEDGQLTGVKKTFKGTVFVSDLTMEDANLSVKDEVNENGIEEENDIVPNDNNFLKPKSKKHKGSKGNKVRNSTESDLSNVSDSRAEDSEFSSSKRRHSKSHKKKKSLETDLKVEHNSELEEFI